MKKILYACTVLAAICSLHAYGQNDNLVTNNAVAGLKSLSGNRIIEKVYLHFDKPAYAAGETIWFKVYMMEAIYPAGVSKSVYFDWTDNTGKILLHSVFPLVNGITNGQFEVPADYAGKALHVRGYTRWMLNFDSAFLYNKDIRIIFICSV